MNETVGYYSISTFRLVVIIDDVVPKVIVRCLPNQKPFVTGEVRAELLARSSAHNSGDLEFFSTSKYDPCDSGG